jgi:hypothetical protein
MRQKLLVFAGASVLFTVLLLVLSGSEATAIIPTSQLATLACSDGIGQAASAAADVVSHRWLLAEPFAETRVSSSILFAGNGTMPCGNAAGRRMGIEAQVQRIFRSGDPGVVDSTGKARDRLVTANQQAYADAATAAKAPSVTIERRYARAKAVIVNVAQTAFAIVPGGLAEDLRRINTCLAGKDLKISQSNLSLTLSCSDEAVRRALADTIAPGFYLGFRGQPAVNLSCDDLKKQAETGATVEIRWAAAKAFILDQECTPDATALTALATAPSSAELQAAATAKMIDLGLGGVPLADAWAAGLGLANGPTPAVSGAPGNCDPTTKATGSLYASALASPGDPTAIAPLARYDTADIALPIAGGGCQFRLGQIEEVRLTIAQDDSANGAQLPLWSFVLTK